MEAIEIRYLKSLSKQYPTVAAAGNVACMANVLRIQARYGNISILEDGYGINLVPLARYTYCLSSQIVISLKAVKFFNKEENLL